MLELESVTLGFGDRVILDKINWQVTDGARVALVGPNGVGKSSLLKIIAGTMEFEEGKIRQSKNAIIGYLPQDLVELSPMPLMDYLRTKSGLTGLENEITETHHHMGEFSPDSREYKEAVERHTEALKRFEHLGGYAFESKAARVLIGLGFKEKEFPKNCTEFSGGWKMRIILAHILLLEADLMLLDEPTNHLDTESMEWLENFLSEFRGTLITVSHDRRFLDKMMTSTAELGRGKLTIYSGNYGYYLEQKELRKAQLEAEARRQEEYIEKTNKFIDRFRAKNTKATQVQSRIKQLEKMERVVIESEVKTVKFHFPEPPKCAYEVIHVENLSHGYDDNSVLENIGFNITQGEKIALVGVNGAGKSTLSRLLSRREEPRAGKVIWGKRVSMGFFAQESRLNLDYAKTIWEEITSVKTEVKEQSLRALLGAFLFSGDDLDKPIEVLSGGEKSRLALCKLLLERHNLLILDEPTNHLDTATRELFQNALVDYKGTLILVTHDRHFLDQLITRVVEIRERQAWYYYGNYSDFLKKRAALLSKDPEIRSKAQESVVAPPPQVLSEPKESRVSVRQLEHKRKQREAAHRRILDEHKKIVQQLEVEIKILEEEKVTVEKTLCDPKIYTEGHKAKALTERLKKLEHLIPSLYEQWETANRDLENVSAGQKDLSL